MINVNSWLECANYVNGGWLSDKVDLINGEQILFYLLITANLIYLFFSSQAKKELKLQKIIL